MGISSEARKRIYLRAPGFDKDVDNAAWYDPSNSQVHIRSLEHDVATLASNIIHELGHKQSHVLRNTIGLENYINLTERLRSNPFISKLLESKISKAYQEVNEDSEHYASKPYLYVEEIIVDMNASVRSGNWKVFADRYDVDVNDIPVELKRKANNIIIKAYDAMRRAFKTVLDIMNGDRRSVV